MEEKIIQDAVEEIKMADEKQIKETIEKWFESTRTSGMKIGASYIAAAVFGIIQKHLKKQSPSLRDYQRMTDDILKIVSVQLKQNDTVQNDLEEKI